MTRIPFGTIVLVWLATFVGGSVAGETQFPQRYYVAVDDVLVRSGPGDDYYATTVLTKGETVEVQRIDHERWGAITPPRGSFSWIEVRVLDPTSLKEVYKVHDQRVRTRVGSRFTKDREVAYVTLQKGDHVKLLEPFPTEKPQQEWVKIAPSKGELRWVPMSALTRVDPHQDPPGPSDQSDSSDRNEPSDKADPAESSELASASDATDSLEPIPVNEDSDEDLSENKVVRAQWSYDLAPRTYDDKSPAAENRPDEKEIPLPPDSPLTLSQAFGELRQAVNAIQHEAETMDGPPAEVKLDASLIASQGADSEDSIQHTAAEDADQLAPAANLLPPSPADGPPPPSPNASAGPSEVALQPTGVGSSGEAAYQESLRIGAELAQMIASADPANWNLQPLRNRAEAVVDTAGSAEVRKNGQDLIARIAQFEDIQRRHRALVAEKTSPIQSPSPEKTEEAGFFRRFGSRGLSRSADRSAGNLADVSRYDGYGWLMPVATNRDNIPKYVLTDNNGNILQFVTPRSGLNLQRYERQRVGIYGEKGYLPSVNQPILTADRIVTMDRVR